MVEIREKWEKLSPKVQNILQIIVGTILAGTSMFLLFRPSVDPSNQGNIFVWFIAFALVLLIPRTLETQLICKLRVLRITILVVMIVCFVSLIIFMLATGKFFSK